MTAPLPVEIHVPGSAQLARAQAYLDTAQDPSTSARDAATCIARARQQALLAQRSMAAAVTRWREAAERAQSKLDADLKRVDL